MTLEHHLIRKIRRFSLHAAFDHLKYVVAIILVYVPNLSHGQISGRVVDQQQMPISFVTVVLENKFADVIEGTVTDSLGHFHLMHLPTDSLRLTADLIGYQSSSIWIMQSMQDVQFVLSETATDLSTVTVTARKPLLQQSHDRLIMNVSAQHSLEGSTALEALSSAPGVLVDHQNRRVSISGKSEALIMINNRLVRIDQSTIVGQLEGMSADQIDRIEIIHQPPAKYNADGNAGIVHVVLKKDEDHGLNGSASIGPGYGQREKLSLSGRFNWRGKSFNLYGNYSHMLNINDAVMLTNNRAYTYEGVSYFHTSDIFFKYQKRRLHTGQIGLDLFPSRKTTIGFLGGISDWWHNTRNRTSSYGEVNGDLSTVYEFGLEPFILNRSYFGNFNVLHEFGEGNTLNFDLDYADYFLESPGMFRDLTGENEVSAIRVDRTSPLKLWTIRAAASRSLSEQSTLTYGGKVSISRLRNNALIENNIDEVWVTDPLFSGRDVVDEAVYAGFISFNNSFSKNISLESGLRYEYYDYQVESTVGERGVIIQRGSFFPVARINYKLDSVQSLQIGFSRRIVRPAFGQLATYFVFVDPSILATGNILLRPAFSNMFRIGYQRNRLLISGEFSYERNHITYRNTVNKESHLQTSLQHNYDDFFQAGLNLSFPLKIVDGWESNNTLIGQHRWLSDVEGRDFPIDLSLSNCIVQSNHYVNLGPKMSLNAAVNYFSKFLQGDQIHRGSIRFNAGLQRKFKSASISFSVTDIFMQAALHRWSHLQPQDGLRTWGHNQWSERVYRITYSFDFGDESVKRQRARRTGSEEERRRANG